MKSLFPTEHEGGSISDCLFASHSADGGSFYFSAHAPGAGVKPLFGRRILLVEDDFFIGFELAQFLQSLGAEVAGPYATSASARDAWRTGEIDGAVLDVNLGRETSLDLAEELKAAAVPVIFVTAYADEEVLFGGELADAPRLAKPVSRAILRRRVSEIFS